MTAGRTTASLTVPVICIGTRGRCPLCATELERAAIVAWLVGYGLPRVANQIDNGLHLAGDDE